MKNPIHPKIVNANDIEEVLCLSTLIASGELSPKATIEDAKEFYTEETNSDCGSCPFNLLCLACIINE